MKSLKSLYKIGPGPSSSHTIGPMYACEYILTKYNQNQIIRVTLFGSLALTGKGHLTDVIIQKTLGERLASIHFDFTTELRHPNGMKFEILDTQGIVTASEMIFSVGGGSIDIDGIGLQLEKEIYPFQNFDEIKLYSKENHISLDELVIKFDEKDILNYLENVYDTMTRSIETGTHKTGELPGGLHVKRKASQLFEQCQKTNEIITTLSAYAFATSEENASGGQIVTAPTCGASGILPAVLYYHEKNLGLSREKVIRALAVAGIFGNVIKSNASISGAMAGCQSEVGSACSMAAAAVSFLNNYSIEEMEYAAEIALEHHLGLTCDPVNGLVQIPCIERNAVAALRAMDAAMLSHLLDGTRTVSFDTVVKTMYETGKDLNVKYRETSEGGLAKNYFCQ